MPCLLTPGLYASSARPTPRVGRMSVHCQPPHHSTPRVSDVRAHTCIVRPTPRVVHDGKNTVVLPTPRVGYVVNDAQLSMPRMRLPPKNVVTNRHKQNFPSLFLAKSQLHKVKFCSGRPRQRRRLSKSKRISYQLQYP